MIICYKVEVKFIYDKSGLCFNICCEDFWGKIFFIELDFNFFWIIL